MSNSKVERKEKVAEKFAAKVKRAIRILENEPQVSLNAVAVSLDLCHKVLKKHYVAYKESGEELRNWSPNSAAGRFPLLSDVQKHILRLFVHTLDQCGYPCSKATLKNAIKTLSGLPSLPSSSYTQKLVKELKLPLRIVNHGLSIRDTKTSLEYMNDFYVKLKELYDTYKFAPCDIYNADEVGIQIADWKVGLFSSRASVRRNLVGDGHLTALLTSNAAGDVWPPFFIFPGSELSCVPGGSLENNAYASFNESAYMDEVLFQQWLSLFLKDILPTRTRYGIIHPVLLIVDGHSSHINPTTSLTAACHDVILLCLPSHMTHLLQPNDCALNKTMKDNLQAMVTSLVESQEEVSSGELAHMTAESLKSPNISRSIIHSFRHTGICPYEPLQMSVLLKNENVKPLLNESEKIVDEVVKLTKDHLSTFDSLVQRKRKREESTAAVRRVRFSTKNAHVLTAPVTQAALRYSKELSGVESMKVDDMRTHMTQKLAFTIADLQKANPRGFKWKTKKEMMEMIQKHYDEKWDETVREIEEEVAQNLIHPRPTAAIARAETVTE